MLGFGISISGINVGLRRLDAAANNIANATTPAFKAARVDAVDVQAGGASVGSIRVNFSQGPIEVASGGFSLSIDGDGFFQVGDLYTRAGAFHIDGDGNVVTAEGQPLQPGIQVPLDAVSLNVSADGTVTSVMPDGTLQQLGQITLTRFPNPGGLTSLGGSLSQASASAGAPIQGVPGDGSFGSLVFGALEGSNVDLASEMVSLIVSKAAVKANIAALKSQDETLGEIIDLHG